MSDSPYRDPDLAVARETRMLHRTPNEQVLCALNAGAVVVSLFMPHFLSVLGLLVTIPCALAVLGIALPGPRRRRMLLLPSMALWSIAGIGPDLAGWRRERMPEMPIAASFELPPDWVCEILSPSTAATDRAEKLPIYAGERVPHVWLIDPLVRTLEVLRLDGETYRAMHVWRDSAVVRAEPFDAIELELDGLWAR